MIESIFLISALALPPLGAVGYQIAPWSASMTIEEEEQMLRWFIWKRAPGAEVVVTDSDEPPGLGYELLPIRWRGKFVWFRRKPICVHREAIERSA